MGIKTKQVAKGIEHLPLEIRCVSRDLALFGEKAIGAPGPTLLSKCGNGRTL